MLEYDGIIYKTFVAKQKKCFRAEEDLTTEKTLQLKQANVSPNNLEQMGYFQIAIWFQNWILGVWQAILIALMLFFRREYDWART